MRIRLSLQETRVSVTVWTVVARTAVDVSKGEEARAAVILD